MADKDTPILKDVADTAAATAGRATRRAADALRRSGEAAAEAGGAGADTVARATEQFRRIFGLVAEADEEAVQQTRRNLETLARCNRVLTDGMQAAWREWLGLAQEVVHRNVDGLDALSRCRSLPDLYAAQSELVKDEMAMLLDRSARLSALSARIADDALHSIGERGGKAGPAA